MPHPSAGAQASSDMVSAGVKPMRLKALAIACFVLVAAFCTLAVGRGQQRQLASALPTGQNGRYQVIPATVDFSATGAMPAKQTVIRLDTQTGKAWELFEQKTPAGGVETLWIPLNESN